MQRSSQLRVLACLILIAALTACQTQPKLPPPDSAESWPSHQAALDEINAWQLRGKLGFRSPENSGSGALNWSQVDDNFDINLRGPFGQGAMQITGGPNKVRVQIAGQGTYESESPSELLTETLGWSAPIESLRYWAIGSYAPGAYDTMQLNADGRLAALHQHGWQIEFIRYKNNGTLDLPQKLKLTREPVKITLVISSWQLGSN